MKNFIGSLKIKPSDEYLNEKKLVNLLHDSDFSLYIDFEQEGNTNCYSDGNITCIILGTVYCCCGKKHCIDAAYLVQKYAEKKESIFSCLEGKYIVAIADKKNRVIYFSRDNFGGFPLFYANNGGCAAVSNSLKYLSSLPSYEKKLDTNGLHDFFTLGYIPAPNTIFSGIKALQPGHYLRLMCKDASLKFDDIVFWDAVPPYDACEDYEEAKSLLRDAIITSVEKCCLNNTVGVFLSGGIDSTLLTGVLSRYLGKNVSTFTIGFDDSAYDESDRAQIVADTFQTDHHLLVLNYSSVFDDLDNVISNFQQPFADASAIPTYILNKYANRCAQSDVITGDGSDQIFAGSNKYLIDYYVKKYLRVPSLFRCCFEKTFGHMNAKGALFRKINKVVSCSGMDIYHMRRRMLQLCLDDDGFEHFCPKCSGSAADIIFDYYNLPYEFPDETAETLYADLKVVADGCMCTKMGEASRFWNVNTHMPLLDKSVIETAFKIPSNYKIVNGCGKKILKDAFSDVIPTTLQTASKKGFDPPMAEWFRAELLDRLEHIIENNDLADLFDLGVIRELISNHISMKQDNSTVLWAVYVFYRWYNENFR